MLYLPLSLRLVLGALVLTAAIFDMRFRRIPNLLNLSGLILGLTLNLVAFRFQGLMHAAEGMLIAAAVYLPLYMLRGMGAGDVKLMAAVGAIVGPVHWLEILLATALAGAFAGAAYAWFKGRLSETLLNLYFLVKDLIQLRAPHKTNPELDFRNPASLRMPHGIVIAVASLGFLIFDLSNPNFLLNLLRYRLAGIF